jgi:hypothetical protein
VGLAVPANRPALVPPVRLGRLASLEDRPALEDLDPLSVQDFCHTARAIAILTAIIGKILVKPFLCVRPPNDREFRNLPLTVDGLQSSQHVRKSHGITRQCELAGM